MSKKKQRKDLLGSLNIHSVAKHQKIGKGALWGNFFSKKVSQKKIEIRDSLVSPGIVRYAEKEEKPFWFCLLGQMIQFVTIKFRRTFKNYFGQFKWTEKRVTIIVAFHFMKRRLKTGPLTKR